MKGILSTTDLDDASLVAKAKASPGLVGRDLAREVMPEASTPWALGLNTSFTMKTPSADVMGRGTDSDSRDSLDSSPGRTSSRSISG